MGVECMLGSFVIVVCQKFVYMYMHQQRNHHQLTQTAHRSLWEIPRGFPPLHHPGRESH